MNQSQPINLSRMDWRSIPELHRFSHRAMATNFEIFIMHNDASVAEQAGWAAFHRLDRLEAELSRFVENSDVSQINCLQSGQSLTLGLDAFECLELSLRLYHQTGGAFDINVGRLVDQFLKADQNHTDSAPSAAQTHYAGLNDLHLDAASHSVRLASSDCVSLDFGGIGKGFALDKMAEVLADWDIRISLLHGGFSSVLALDAPPQMNGWPVTISNPQPPHQIFAPLYPRRCALGASGLQKGLHIINPHTEKPASHTLAAWTCAADAATADALSTAFMVMPLEEIEKFCNNFPDICAAILPAELSENRRPPSLQWLGQWEKLKADGPCNPSS